MTAGMAVGMDAFNRPIDQPRDVAGNGPRMALGFGVFALLWIPYWFVESR